jgi:hypothetical protein
MGVLAAAQGLCLAATTDTTGNQTTGIQMGSVQTGSVQTGSTPTSATPPSSNQTTTKPATGSSKPPSPLTNVPGKLSVNTRQDLLNPPVDKPIQRYPVTVWVNVPHYRDSIQKFRAVPYITEIPTPLHNYGPMSEKYADLKDSLYILCFLAPQNAQKHRYSGQGWRFTYCLEAAKREAGLGTPHLLPEAREWCEQMYPHLHKFVVRSNEAEALRHDRCTQAQQDYQENKGEFEYAALKKGFFPIDLKFTIYHLSLFRSVTELPEGNWWITGTHKVIGITYYWQEPIEVGADKPNGVVLTEANALQLDSQAW